MTVTHGGVRHQDGDEAIKDNRIELKVTDKTMGGDPHRGHPKHLRVTFFYDSEMRSVEVAQGETLKIPA
jgi:hypothetical protein